MKRREFLKTAGLGVAAASSGLVGMLNFRNQNVKLNPSNLTIEDEVFPQAYFVFYSNNSWNVIGSNQTYDLINTKKQIRGYIDSGGQA